MFGKRFNLSGSCSPFEEEVVQKMQQNERALEVPRRRTASKFGSKGPERKRAKGLAIFCRFLQIARAVQLTVLSNFVHRNGRFFCKIKLCKNTFLADSNFSRFSKKRSLD